MSLGPDDKPEIVRLWTEIGQGGHRRHHVALKEPLPPITNRGPRREPDGQSALPRFNRYSIPHKVRPGEIECPYCVKRPLGAKGLRDHCRAQHPDKPEAR